MKRLGIDYEAKRNCFEDISNIHSNLIWGELQAIPKPWISYIIPVYKRADLLEETLASVLAQKPVDFEWDIVIVDNEAGGENDTERLIKKLKEKRILYYRNQENLGPDGNYNRCIELARGEWLAMVHGDDLVVDDHLQRMGTYIRQKEKGRKHLAYISPRYQDFKDRKAISTRREGINDPYTAYRGRIKRFCSIDSLITGYSVGLPSFGTIMNKEVMIKTGGFDERLGICEDVITPYRLTKDFRVYATPEIMGFHRFEGNESIKTKTIFRICEAMTDFREYMFSDNVLSRLWGSIARTPFFDLLSEYCSYLSGFSDTRLKKTDFAYIYPERRDMSLVARIAFDGVERLYCLVTGAVTYEKGIELSIGKIISVISNYRKTGEIIVYGAGRAGRNAGRILKKKYGISLKAYAVTKKIDNDTSINGIPVVEIEELKTDADKSLVILATSVPEFFDEMYEKLNKYGFKNVIPLDEKFRNETYYAG